MTKDKPEAPKPIKQPSLPPGDFCERVIGKIEINKTSDTVEPPRTKPGGKEK